MMNDVWPIIPLPIISYGQYTEKACVPNAEFLLYRILFSDYDSFYYFETLLVTQMVTRSNSAYWDVEY